MQTAESSGTDRTQSAAFPGHRTERASPIGSILTEARGLTEAEAGLVQRFDPAGPRDTIGFFIAKFCKLSW